MESSAAEVVWMYGSLQKGEAAVKRASERASERVCASNRTMELEEEKRANQTRGRVTTELRTATNVFCCGGLMDCL